MLREGTEVTVAIEAPPTLSEDEKRTRFAAAVGAWTDLVDESIKEELRVLRHVKTRPQNGPFGYAAKGRG